MGKGVLDAANYYPSRDGRIEELDEETLTIGQFAQQGLPGAKLVRACRSPATTPGRGPRTPH
ncbi:hypothetical protein AB0O76_38970 [Streptomyces sp. NPDC086554]|uniref:hypothetical protein n=1 Tax=Streptomyces sp. NPDC086554 TaxID=3154864 RepID=UPI00343D72A2